MSNPNHLFTLLAFCVLLVPVSNQAGDAASLTRFPNATETAPSDETQKAELLAGLAVRVSIMGKVESAEQLFERSLQLVQNLPVDEYGREPVEKKIELFGAIAVQLAKAGQTDQAEQIFTRAEQLAREKLESWEQNTALNGLAIKLAEAGFTEKAVQLTNTLFQDQTQDERNYNKAKTLNDIASQLIHAGKLEQAKPLLSDTLTLAQGISEQAGYESNGGCSRFRYETLAAIAKNLTLVNQVQPALDIVQTVSRCSSASGEGGTNYRLDGVLGIVSYLMNARQLMQTDAVVQALQDEPTKNRMFYAIAVKLARVGEAPLARQVAQQISERPLKEFALLSIASFSLHTGDKRQAQQVFFQTQTIAQKYPHYLDKEETLADVAVNLVEAGQTEMAVQVAKSGNWVLNKVAVKLAEVGQSEQALQLIEAIEDEQLWKAVVAQFDDLASLNRAFQIVQGMKFENRWGADFSKSEMLLSIAKRLAELKQYELAIQVAQTIPDDAVKAQALAIAAVQLSH